MNELSLAEGIRHALATEMREDERVVVLGEDVATTGGIFGTTNGLAEEFGDQRVLDMPMAEGSLVGTAVGMAMRGLRPVAEVQLADSLYPAFDQVVSEMAKLRYRSGGQYACPMVLRVPYGGGVNGGPYQSQSPEGYFCHTAGLTVVAASAPRDAVGLLRSAMRSPDPVVFLEPKRLYSGATEQVPEEDFETPLGQACLLRDGTDLTLLTYGGCVGIAKQAAERAAEAGIQVEVVDLRTLLPFDIEMVLASVAKTGRAVIVSEAPKFCGFAAELVATMAERAILHLEAPVARVSGFDTPVPYAFDDDYLPDATEVFVAIERVANF